MKRFWTKAEAHGLSVLLDGKPVKLPGIGTLTLTSTRLAEAIAQEWASAPADFTPDDLPLTRLASTAQERIPPHRDNIIGQLAAYGLNDLLCYRADSAAALVLLQAAEWNPWLAWLRETHGITLHTTTGIIPIGQPDGTRERFTDILSAHSDAWLAAMGVIVPALGSLVLALALAEGALAPPQACDLALLDELWQERQWGTDSEAAARRERLRDDVAVSADFIRLSGAA